MQALLTICILLLPYTVMIILYLFYASRVNHKVEDHIQLLLKQKHVFESLLANIDTFDFDLYLKGEYVTFSQTLKHSIAYLKGIQDTEGKDRMKEQLQEGIDGMQAVIDKLEYENEYNPHRLLGFVLNEDFFY